MDKKSSLLAFMLGMAVGSAVTWQMIKDRYERRIEEDRKSLEEMYAAKLEEASAKVQPVEEEPEAETLRAFLFSCPCPPKPYVSTRGIYVGGAGRYH